MITKKQKKLGQVFLKDKKVVQKIIQAAEIKPKDQILEIGPGKGVLTESLLKTGAEIIAVEKDPELVEFLKNIFKNKSNLNITQGDIRDFFQNTKYQTLKPGYKAMGNIPYYLTSRLLRLLLENSIKPKLIVLMIQKEVAERLMAKPPKMNLLSASVQFYAKPEIICYVPKTAFNPIPKVDSAIVIITPINTNINKKQAKIFFTVVKAGFRQPRKLLINNLSKNLKIKKDFIQKIFLRLNISLNTRAQNLSIKEWASLSSLLIKNIV